MIRDHARPEAGIRPPLPGGLFLSRP